MHKFINSVFYLSLLSSQILNSQCTGVPNYTPCDDGNLCTLYDYCFNGNCIGGTPKNCNDGNFCTDDNCNPTTGACFSVFANGKLCNDGDACTNNDYCLNGDCVSIPNPCNASPCQQFLYCDPVIGCVFYNLAGACDDGSVCTIDDQCVNGICTGIPISCPDDNDPCTIPMCNPISGCYLGCDDGNPCTYNDQCVNGVCQGTLSPTTRFVLNEFSYGSGSLRDVIATACEGDTIKFLTTVDTILLSKVIPVNKNLYIIGNGVTQTTISGQFACAAFNVPIGINVLVQDITFIRVHRAVLSYGITSLKSVDIYDHNSASNQTGILGGLGEIKILQPGTLNIKTEY